MYTISHQVAINNLASSLNLTAKEKHTVLKAMSILASKRVTINTAIEDPASVVEYARVYFAFLQGFCVNEIFSVMYLNSAHELIECEQLFRGTIDGANVWPREIIRGCITHNAKSIVLIHNHPSGKTLPSDKDKQITRRITEACEYIDVNVIDHIIVSNESSFSFAENFLI